MGFVGKPLSSSALRMAATRPSIMSLGAITSAPARACDTAVFASHPSVMSLSTSLFTTYPQWPWLVYSQLHTSVTTSRPGTPALIPRIARWTIPLSACAPEAISSFTSGMPNRITPPMPSRFASAHSFTSSSTESWQLPGMEPISRRTPSPGQTNSGRMNCSGESRVSRTRERS